VAQEQNQKIKEILSSERGVGEKIDEIAKIRGWFRPDDDSIYYPIVLESADDHRDVEEISSRLVAPIDEKISSRNLDDVNFMDLWYSIIHTAKRKPVRENELGGDSRSQDRAVLVDLVAAIKHHKIPGNEQYNYIYESLTDFSMACREAYNDPPREMAFDLEVDAWANVNNFFAQVTHRNLANLSIFAIWAMRQALEYDYQDDEEGTAAQRYDMFVPAAAAWVFGMGKSLARKREDLTPTDRKHGNPGKGGELWKGKAEFSEERWNFWKERFAVIAEMKGVSSKTIDIAKGAVEAMERAETFEDVRHSANLGPE
jgi:hypothetical protein